MNILVIGRKISQFQAICHKIFHRHVIIAARQILGNPLIWQIKCISSIPILPLGNLCQSDILNLNTKEISYTITILRNTSGIDIHLCPGICQRCQQFLELLLITIGKSGQIDLFVLFEIIQRIVIQILTCTSHKGRIHVGNIQGRRSDRQIVSRYIHTELSVYPLQIKEDHICIFVHKGIAISLCRRYNVLCRKSLWQDRFFQKRTVTAQFQQFLESIIIISVARCLRHMHDPHIGRRTLNIPALHIIHILFQYKIGNIGFQRTFIHKAHTV